MITSRPVIIKRLPEQVSQIQAETLAREVGSYLEGDHPYLVFDFSDVCHLDSAGIEVLVECMEEAVKRNGDLKLAAISPTIAAILRLTRVDCLFEIFDNASNAATSFYQFPVHAFQPNGEAVSGTCAEDEAPAVALSEDLEKL